MKTIKKKAFNISSYLGTAFCSLSLSLFSYETFVCGETIRGVSLQPRYLSCNTVEGGSTKHKLCRKKQKNASIKHAYATSRVSRHFRNMLVCEFRTAVNFVRD